MKEYVHQYIKNNQEAILRGDSATLVRQDATPGGSYRRMVQSLEGWEKTYIPEQSSGETPKIYMGLGQIAESMNDFNSKQWEKSAKAELGVEFPVYEEWWPDTKKLWAAQNYELIRSLAGDYIKQVNIKAEQAVTGGWSPTQLAQSIMKIDQSISAGRANLIARDQIGKLNGQVTQSRMESLGLELYVWSTSGDERVRDSHAELEGKLCRWDDSTVYSEDSGKTWKDRPSDWCQLHPGYDIQCRCTALSYWDELVGEVDQQIDLLSQDDDNVNSGRDGLNIMGKPPVKTEDELLKEQKAAEEQARMKRNAKATADTAKKDFPNETWLPADDVKLNYENLPKNLDGISIAKSKFPMNKDDEKILLKEVKQAKILTEKGAIIRLIRKVKDSLGNFVHGPDAIINGKYSEFKTITGSLGKVERRFRESRVQSENVFLKIDNKGLSKHSVVNKIRNILKDPDYTGGTKGDLILYLSQTKKTYFIRIKDLK
jgi:SPP1 gp7 family putative phage head morphogenesis protein